jgi:hypothetical protein
LENLSEPFFFTQIKNKNKKELLFDIGWDDVAWL